MMRASALERDETPASAPPTLHVDRSRCIRCAACRTMCPGVFAWVDGAPSVSRSPARGEHALVEAARLICPTDAIRGDVRGPGASEPGRQARAAFDELAIVAESARWPLHGVPWHALDPAEASPWLVALVGEMAIAESTTYSATQRFLDALFDELSMSKWISIWFYEETRHPHVLLEWLRRVGAPVAAQAEIDGRVTTPFMRSLFGTLVTNVISEIAAAQAYRRLSARSAEPVLSTIAQWIAGDEARHAASFYRFAHDWLAEAEEKAARRERERAVEILQVWLGESRSPTHPVARLVQRLDEPGGDLEPLGLDLAAARGRVVRVLGLLLDLPLRRQDDVAPALRELRTKRGTT